MNRVHPFSKSSFHHRLYLLLNRGFGWLYLLIRNFSMSVFWVFRCHWCMTFFHLFIASFCPFWPVFCFVSFSPPSKLESESVPNFSLLAAHWRVLRILWPRRWSMDITFSFILIRHQLFFVISEFLPWCLVQDKGDSYLASFSQSILNLLYCGFTSNSMWYDLPSKLHFLVGSLARTTFSNVHMSFLMVLSIQKDL